MHVLTKLIVSDADEAKYETIPLSKAEDIGLLVGDPQGDDIKIDKSQRKPVMQFLRQAHPAAGETTFDFNPAPAHSKALPEPDTPKRTRAARAKASTPTGPAPKGTGTGKRKGKKLEKQTDLLDLTEVCMICHDGGGFDDLRWEKGCRGLPKQRPPALPRPVGGPG